VVPDQVGNRLHEDRGQLDLDGTFNPLNQLTGLEWSGKLDVAGSVATGGPFTNKVNGVVSAIYNTTNFLGGATVKPGSNAISVVTVDPSGTNETLRTVYIPPTNPQKITYDLNGNMISDGERNFTWDEENRLTAIETVPATVPVADRKKTTFLRDGRGMMVQRTDYSTWNGSAYAATNVTRHVRDGYRILAEISGGTTNYHVWGLDLSQSLDDAGGVGGLLATVRAMPSAPCGLLFTYDGNGNVTDVMGTNGNVVGSYQYDPFGRVVSGTGPCASSNLWQFSTKLFDPIWEFVYYEFRPYSPNLHLFLSRDPIEELRRLSTRLHGEGEDEGDWFPMGVVSPFLPEVSLYWSVANNVINSVDAYGLQVTHVIPSLEIECCVEECNIDNLSISGQWISRRPNILEMTASWSQSGECLGLELYFWTCTWQHAIFGALFGVDRQGRTRKPPSGTIVPIAWRAGQITGQGMGTGSYTGIQIVTWYARLQAESCEDGKWITKHFKAKNGCISNSGFAINCNLAPPSWSNDPGFPSPVAW
jgi:RHS repeat-associated protein